MNMWKLVLLIAAITASFVSEVHAQIIQEGDWIGQIIHKDGRYMDVTYKVRNTEHGLQIVLDAGERGSFQFRNIRTTPDSLFFVWDPSFELPCTLVRLSDGVYHGVCKDPWGDFGGAVMAPPGSDRRMLAIDEVTFKRVAGLDLVDSETEEWLLGELYPKGGTAELDGAKVNYVDVGDGPVTVVLIAGLGDNLTSWESLQQCLAQGFRVISYDRPGLGLSEESEMPRTPEQMAIELHSLLESISAPSPYLLIAHAEGALIARQFVDLHLEEVQGLVLINPHHEEQARIWEALDAEAWQSYWSRLKRFQSSLPGGAGQEFDVYAGIIDEEIELEFSDAPSVPTTVLTAGRALESPGWLGDSQEGLQAWSKFHASWVESIPSGVHMILESGSYIHQEQPEKVEEIIHNMLSSD